MDNEAILGLEKARKAGWARAYAAEEKLRLYQDKNGRTFIFVDCPHCGSYVEELEVEPMFDPPGPTRGCLVTKGKGVV